MNGGDPMSDRRRLSLTLEEMKEMDPKDYMLVDVRDQSSYSHGFIPGSVNIEMEVLLNGENSLPMDKKTSCIV